MRNAEGASGAAPIQPKEKNMKHPIAALGLLTLASLSTACTRYIHDTFNVDAGSGATLDAQQRVILVTKQGGPEHNQFLVCAEPSPDAISAIAGAVALQGGNAEVQGGLNAAMSEAAASIGIRTPTIQLLRDGLYRACEGYLNGILDRESYQIILRNYDRVMVALLALDAAAGSPRAQNISISGGDVQVQGGSGKGASAGAGDGGSPGGETPGSITIKAQAGAAPASAPSLVGIEHADQVMKTVADYMLDNNKWYVANCLTIVEQRLKPHPTYGDTVVDPAKEDPARIPNRTRLPDQGLRERSCRQVQARRAAPIRRRHAIETLGAGRPRGEARGAGAPRGGGGEQSVTQGGRA